MGFPFLSTSASAKVYKIGPSGLEMDVECVKDDVHRRRGTQDKRLLAPFEKHADKEFRTVVWDASKAQGGFSGRRIPVAFTDKLCLEGQQKVGKQTFLRAPKWDSKGKTQKMSVWGGMEELSVLAERYAVRTRYARYAP